MLTFRLDDQSMSSHYERALKSVCSMFYKDKLDEYGSTSKLRSDFLDEPFAQLGNVLLDELSSDAPPERRIKFLTTNNPAWEYDDEKMCPDISIVPVDVTNETLRKGEMFDWRQVLVTAEVRLSSWRHTAKRVHDDDGENEGPPRKRSRSLTSDCVSSTAAVIGTGIMCSSDMSNAKDAQSHPGNPSHYDQSSPATESQQQNHNRDLLTRGQGSNSDVSSGETLRKGTTEYSVASYCADMFSFRGDRSFAIGACVHGTVLKLILYSHSGIVESDEIDLLTQSVLFAVFLSLLLDSSPSDIGFNAKTGFCNPYNVDDDETLRLGVELCAIGSEGNSQVMQPNFTRHVKLGQRITSSRCLVGRGTAVYRLDVPDYSPGLVIKYNWQPLNQCCEVANIKMAREADPIHTPEIFGYAIVKDDSPLQQLRECCGRKSRDNEIRELRVIVMREYTTITKLGLDDEFWDVLSQLMGCKSLYVSSYIGISDDHF